MTERLRILIQNSQISQFRKFSSSIITALTVTNCDRTCPHLEINFTNVGKELFDKNVPLIGEQSNLRQYVRLGEEITWIRLVSSNPTHSLFEGPKSKCYASCWNQFVHRKNEGNVSVTYVRLLLFVARLTPEVAILY